jgi:hypothetical protein
MFFQDPSFHTETWGYNKQSPLWVRSPGWSALQYFLFIELGVKTKNPNSCKHQKNHILGSPCVNWHSMQGSVKVMWEGMKVYLVFTLLCWGVPHVPKILDVWSKWWHESMPIRAFLVEGCPIYSSSNTQSKLSIKHKEQTCVKVISKAINFT